MGSLWLKNGRNFCLCLILIPSITLVFVLLFIRNYENVQMISRLHETVPPIKPFYPAHVAQFEQIVSPSGCEVSCKPSGSEALPEGIISRTTDLEMVTLWGSPLGKNDGKNPKSLLAMAVGIKQKQLVDKIVNKFLLDNFRIMLFHYDGNVDKWKDFQWSSSIIHVSAINQTKWWFAKRFLHPDIVTEYSYIFLWDEDLGVENFHPKRYLTIIQEEGLEISQPALDASKSEVHHQITMRRIRTKVHRRIYKSGHGTKCDGNSTDPPCTGWVEMMAPVFSKAAWRCAWHMIQNDLIHAWGLDIMLGYCAQGDRSKNVGIVDVEYVVHKGIPSLGGFHRNLPTTKELNDSPQSKNSSEPAKEMKPHRVPLDNRQRVRLRSGREFITFKSRWRQAVIEDKCWNDPYPESTITIH